MLLVTCLYWQAWRLGFSGRRYRVGAIRCDSDGRWHLHLQNRWVVALRRDDSRIWRNLLWLRWDTETGSVWTVLVRSRAPVDAWRQLQVRLRLPRPSKKQCDRNGEANPSDL